MNWRLIQNLANPLFGHIFYCARGPWSNPTNWLQLAKYMKRSVPQVLLHISTSLLKSMSLFIGLALVGKDIVFGFIIEYSSLRDFYRPLDNNNRSFFFNMRISERWLFWLVLKLEISYYRVMISWRILVSFRGFFFFFEIINFLKFFFCPKITFF
jgi:hypothetical protein